MVNKRIAVKYYGYNLWFFYPKLFINGKKITNLDCDEEMIELEEGDNEVFVTYLFQKTETLYLNKITKPYNCILAKVDALKFDSQLDYWKPYSQRYTQSDPQYWLDCFWHYIYLIIGILKKLSLIDKKSYNLISLEAIKLPKNKDINFSEIIL